MALASPFFQAFELDKRIELRVPEISYAHAVDATTAGIAFRSLTRTVDGLGPDGDGYRRLFQPLVERVDGITDLTMHQLLRIPRDRLGSLLYAARTLEQGGPWWNTRFKGDIAPAMVTGVSAHCIGSLPGLATSGTAMLLGAHAHARGWPLAVGGSQSIADAMAEDLLNHGGEIVLDSPITGLAEVRDGCRPKAILLDLSAAGLAQVAGAELPTPYLRKLGSFRYGNAVSKVDFALSGPIPWANPALAAAPTVHLGGTRAEMARPRPKLPPEDIPGSHLSLPANRRPWTAAEPPQETTFCGPTPTSLQAPPWTRQKWSSVGWNSSRRASVTSSWQRTLSQPSSTANTTRTTLEATSPQGRCQPANYSNDRSSHPTLGGHRQKVSTYVHPQPRRVRQSTACVVGMPPNPRLNANLDCPHHNSATNAGGERALDDWGR